MLNRSFFSSLGFTLAIAGSILLPTAAKASTTESTQTLLDWDQLADTGVWNSTSPGGTFAAGEGTISIEFERGSGVRFAPYPGSGPTPSISDVLNGSLGADDRSLHIQIDANQVGLTKGDYSISMITKFQGFTQPLQNVSFMLYDIDIVQNRWQDRVILKGFLGDELVNPVFTPVLSSGTVIQIVDAYTLDGIGFADNFNSDNGTVLVKFASAIDKFELVFTDGDDIGKINPSSHGIGIGDIKYTVHTSVPEPNSILGLLTFVGLGTNAIWKFRQKQA